MDNKNCTRCGKAFDKFRVTLMLATTVERKAANDVWENLPNLNAETLEILCEDCFEQYSNTVTNAMNIKKENVKY